MNTEPDQERVKLYDAQFAADPGGVYETLRARYGNYAPAELAPGVPVTVVLGYDAALEVLRDPVTFPKDPRRWERTMPAECPVRPVMGYRPGVLYSDGAEHSRFRKTITDTFERADAVSLREYVEQSADLLIDRFAEEGEADLAAQYSAQLPLLVFNRFFGCPPDIGDRLVQGLLGVAELVDPGQAMATFNQAALELARLKRVQPASDIVSWMAEHPANLTDEELADQIGLLMATGTAPVHDLVANALRLLLSDERFAGDLSGGSLPIEDALDEVLWTDPPIANFGFTYPVRNVEREGHVMPADQPVAIAYKAVNTDPSKWSAHRTGNRAHLAFSAGPHTCPAKGPARIIATIALEKLLDRLPDLDLAVSADKIQWRPGPFHRSMAGLPVRFTPVPVLTPTPEPDHPPARALAPVPRQPVAPPPAPSSFWARVAAWWRA
ncbi:cytochrome P450 family protein [Actinocorallia populi]|uniref:cytochrome P450 n=1 Tax=Actinocorallia populi TaxID=2079200 RepID=UPI000D089D4E|nr:cytochrome P450 [Actinocorallia populi]